MLWKSGTLVFDDIQFIGATQSGLLTSGVGAIAPALPYTYIKDDLLMLFVESANQAITTPSGWTQVTNSPQSTGTAGAAGGVRLGVFYRLATGPIVSAPSIADTGDHTTAVILCFRKVDTTTPIDISAGGVLATAGTTITLSSVTTTVAKVLTLLCVANDRDFSGASLSAWSNGSLTSITELFDGCTTAGTGGGIGVASGIKTVAGSTGTSQVTNGASVTAAHMTIGLRPSTGYSAGRAIGVGGRNLFDGSPSQGVASSLVLSSDGSANAQSSLDFISGDIGSQWYDSVTSGIGSSFWVRHTILGVDQPDTQPGAGWNSLSSGLTWEASLAYVVGGETASVEILLEFATDSSGTNIVAVGLAILTMQTFS